MPTAAFEVARKWFETVILASSHLQQYYKFCKPIHVISPYFGGISLFLSKSPYLEFQNFPIYITYTSPYFKFQISLFEIKNFLLCVICIILPISKRKSPFLAPQMYHMYANPVFWCCGSSLMVPVAYIHG